jgi:2,3-diketo-5-methylthio-1-phosphopentane phosphatase
LFIACDFDGTITARDTLHVIVETYGERRLWDDIEPRLRRGEITIEEAMQEEFASVRATADEVRQLVLRDAPIRPGFAELVRWAEQDGHPVLVISSGFRSVIDAVLADANLDHLEVRGNEAIFSPAGTRIDWSERGEVCAVCDRRCKRHDLRERMRPEDALIYVGDGISDRCVSLIADRVYARAGLAEYLREENVPHTVFDDFHQILADLRANGVEVRNG